jgi:hypothetical protein
VTDRTEDARLPLWRTVSGFAVLLGLAAVLLSLLPIYIGNFRLTQFLTTISADRTAENEDVLRSRILARARQLDLPVRPDDIHIGHEGGKIQFSLRYKVQKDLGLAHVDLHFHPAGR